jgi:hypothetical protein
MDKQLAPLHSTVHRTPESIHAGARRRHDESTDSEASVAPAQPQRGLKFDRFGRVISSVAARSVGSKDAVVASRTTVSASVPRQQASQPMPSKLLPATGSTLQAGHSRARHTLRGHDETAQSIDYGELGTSWPHASSGDGGRAHHGYSSRAHIPFVAIAHPAAGATTQTCKALHVQYRNDVGLPPAWAALAAQQRKLRRRKRRSSHQHRDHGLNSAIPRSDTTAADIDIDMMSSIAHVGLLAGASKHGHAGHIPTRSFTRRTSTPPGQPQQHEPILRNWHVLQDPTVSSDPWSGVKLCDFPEVKQRTHRASRAESDAAAAFLPIRKGSTEKTADCMTDENPS